MTRRRIFGLAALAAFAVAAASSQPNAPTASVTGGAVRGAMESGQAVFKGVPFAAPPVEALRWREPQPVAAWQGTRDASKFGAACMQPSAPSPSENCLTLNVWAPEWPSKGAKPVMVWFHGGGNTEGWTDAPYYYGSDLAKRGVVVVTAQYRLGVFGFFAHPELTKESPNHASGNYGLLDQIAALKWVQANIASFGGDPNNVTIFGESAGAEDVGLLLVSPLAKGLFHRAIAESGPLRKLYPTLAEQERRCAQVAEALDAPSTNQIAYLRGLPASAVLSTAFANQQVCAPVNLDGYALADQPLKLYAEGKQAQVPFMLGNTLREGFIKMPLPSLRETIRQDYRGLAARVLDAYGLGGPQPPPYDPVYGDASVQYGTDQAHRCRVMLTGLQHAATGKAFYQFQFSRDIPGQMNGSTHTDEIPYVFGEPALTALKYNAPDQRKLSAQMVSYWTNFAKTGDPNGPDLPKWSAFDGKTMAYMSFAPAGPTAGEGLRREQCEPFLEREKQSPTWRAAER